MAVASDNGMVRQPAARCLPGAMLARARAAIGFAPHHRTIRGRLLGLALGVAIPLLILAGAGIWESRLANREAAQERLIAHARAMALLLDQEFTGAEQALRTLIASTALARGDLDAFQLEMKAAAAATGALAINLAGSDGFVLRSSLWAPGVQLRVSGTVARDALENGQVMITNLYDSPTTHQPAVAVIVPFELDQPGGRARYALGLVVRRDRLLSVLTDQHLPRSFHASIVDRNKIMVARTLRDKETVGHSARPDVIATMVNEEGIAAYDSWEGKRIISAYALAPRSGFWTRINVPEDEFLAPVQSSLTRLALIGLVLLAAALCMALLLARRFAASLRFLTPGGARPAEAAYGSGFVEVDALAKALAEASADRDDALAEMRLLWATSPIGMARIDGDGDGVVQVANEAFLRMVGVKLADIEAGGVNWDELTPPEWRVADRRALAEANASGASRPHEREFLGPKGRRVPVLVVFRLMPRARGQYVVFVVDLTDRKRSEAALAQTRAMLQQAQEVGGVGLWNLDLADATAAVSAACLAIHGLPDAEDGTITYEDWLSLVVPEDRERVARQTRAAADGTTRMDAEFRIRRADTGAVRWLHAKAERLAGGGPVHLAGTVQDITARKAAETAAQDSACTVQSLLASTTDCVKLLDAEGRIIFVNPAAARQLGADPAALVGLAWPDLWDDESAATIRAALASAMSGQHVRFTKRLRSSAGAALWWDVAISPISGPDGQPMRCVAVSRDVTLGRKPEPETHQGGAALLPHGEAVQALVETERGPVMEVDRRDAVQTALLQAQKLEALGQLTSGVVHDFNNILTAIQGTFDLLARRVHDPRGVRLLQSGGRATARAAALIRHLLSFARQEEPTTVVIDPRLLLPEVSELVGHAIGRTIRLVVEPVFDGIWTVTADLQQLEVALLNLAVNARDAMPDGGTLTFAAHNLSAAADNRLPGMPDGDCVLLEVSDTGLGMPPEVVARASEAFYTTKDRGRGTGLGLAMVHTMAQQFGGAVHIRSEPGIGTTITVALPRAHQPVPEPACDDPDTLRIVDDEDRRTR